MARFRRGVNLTRFWFGDHVATPREFKPNRASRRHRRSVSRQPTCPWLPMLFPWDAFAGWDGMGAISRDAGWILSEDRQLGDFAVTGIVWPDGIGVCGGFAGCVSAECWLIFFFLDETYGASGRRLISTVVAVVSVHNCSPGEGSGWLPRTILPTELACPSKRHLL